MVLFEAGQIREGGPNPLADLARPDQIRGGPNPRRTKSAEDQIRGGPNPRRTKSAEDQIRGGPNPRRTKSASTPAKHWKCPTKHLRMSDETLRMSDDGTLLSLVFMSGDRFLRCRISYLRGDADGLYYQISLIGISTNRQILTAHRSSIRVT